MNVNPCKKILGIARKSSLAAVWFMSVTLVYATPGKIKITLVPNQPGLSTTHIQAAIDSSGEHGGGTVFFPAGTYRTGGIQLRSNVTLQTEQGTLIQGSDQYIHYKNDALIFGENLTDIAIVGAGIIDGVDCKNAAGEEGFRGPHGIRLVNCKNISIQGITIKNSGNWAINCRYCSDARVERVSIRAGHDGLHTRFCNNFTVTECDFRTGDDAVAGNDNQDFLVTDCKINTSCNGFRFGCDNLTVKRCTFWGPGEYIHKIQKRNNMLSAFVHFSPEDENPQLFSGHWLIEDITVDHVDHFYIYNYSHGLWQTGKPVTDLRFKGIKATNLLSAFTVVGDTARHFKLTIQNSSFSFREGASPLPDPFEGLPFQSQAFFNASNFNTIKIQHVTFDKKGTDVIFTCNSGNALQLKHTKFITEESGIPYLIQGVKKTNQ